MVTDKKIVTSVYTTKHTTGPDKLVTPNQKLQNRSETPNNLAKVYAPNHKNNETKQNPVRNEGN